MQNADQFYRELQLMFKKCFLRVRIVKNKPGRRNTNDENLQESMKIARELKLFLKTNQCKIVKKIAEVKLDEYESKNFEETAKLNADKIRRNVEEVETSAGIMSQLKVWNLKTKLMKNDGELPIAKVDEEGNLITAPETLKQLYSKTYQMRLQKRKMWSHYEELEDLKVKLWNQRLELVMKETTPDWSLLELNEVLKTLKNKKCRDPNGLYSEVFKDEYAGKDLKLALL